MNHLLSILLLIPAVGAIVVPCLPRRAIRWTALGVASLACVFSLLLLLRFDTHPASGPGASGSGVMQLVERTPWIVRFHIDYLVGIDGLSLPLVLLTTFIFAIAVGASFRIEKLIRLYFALLLILESAVLGAFVSLDCVLFCAFFELSLMPVYLLIGFWGGPRKEQAALKFLLCMLAGSLVMLGALVLISLNMHSFNLMALPALVADKMAASRAFVRWSPLLFALILAACFIKSAPVPLHTSLANALVEAPAALSMILSAVMLKTGTYAMLRIAYPLFPEAAKHLWLPIAIIGAGSIVYGALCAMAQGDFKRLVAFASVALMGFVFLGLALFTTASFNGAMLMMVAHGIIVAMLLLIGEVIFSRAGHRDLALLGGLASTMPKFWGFSAASLFASIGLPGFCLFVAETLVLLGIFGALRGDSILLSGNFARRGTIYALVIVAMIGIILLAGSMLLALQRIFFGSERAEQKSFPDIDERETALLATLAGVAILLGIFPGPLFFSMTGKTVDAMFGRFDHSAPATQVSTEANVP